MSLETERRNRIRIALWAYAYEFMADPMADDALFDETAKSIDTTVDTGHPVLDKFFREEFGPETGQWIHRHPELEKIASLYRKLQKNDSATTSKILEQSQSTEEL